MNKEEYKKTYKPFIAWLIGFPIITVAITKNLSDVSMKTSVLVSLITMVISLYLLMLMVYKGEYVYWINGGPTYEEAKEAGSEKRKEYAKAHLDIFFRMMLRSFLYVIISLLIKFPMWVDIVVISLVVVIETFATIHIKFDKL